MEPDDSTDEFVGRYYYDDGGFRVRRISRREVDGRTHEHEMLYTSMYMGIEIQRGSRRVIKDSYASVNNTYLNGLRVAAMTPSGDLTYFLTDQVVRSMPSMASRTLVHPCTVGLCKSSC